MLVFKFQPEAAQAACKSACAHIANRMLEKLLDENIKQVSMGALNQINLDLLQCERMYNSTIKCIICYYD